jgi:hypothetical protein
MLRLILVQGVEIEIMNKKMRLLYLRVSNF